MWVHLKTKQPFAFAELWDVWRKPDGKRVESFTIITTEPNELVRPVHNRMPVILRPEDEEQWLDASRTSFAKAKSALTPYPDELMDAHDVSPIVNSAKYDGPDCIQPVSDDMPFDRAVVPVVSLVSRSISGLVISPPAMACQVSSVLLRPQRLRSKN